MKIMNKLALISLLILRSHVAFAVPSHMAYVTNDLAKFESTNSCVNCNLVSAFITGQPHANLSGANLINAEIEGNLDSSNFSQANLTHADFYFANLPNSNFNSAILTNTSFWGADLSNADFTGATLMHVAFEFTILCGAKISDSQLINARLNEATMMPDCTFYKKK